MNITLYGLVPFDRGGKARWLLEELGVKYDNHWLDGDKKEHEGEAYLRVNPLGRVPALVIDGRPMAESSAICTYLADLFMDKGFAPALNSPDRAEYQQWMYFAAATLDPFIARIMIIEDIPPGEVFKAKETALLTDLRDIAEYLESVLSKKEYLVANRFGAADICVGYHLEFCFLWPELKAVLDGSPSLARYLERLKKRPAAEKSKIFSFPG